MDKVESNSLREIEWLDLRGLTNYAAVSERTAREWIHLARNPLPAVQVGKKILVRRSVFDHWLEQHQIQPVESMDVNGLVNEIMSGLAEAE